MEENNTKSLINKVISESDSEKDRKEIDNLKSLNLIHFINGQLEKALSKDCLRNSVLSKLKNRVDTNDPEAEELNNVELIKLLEILEKADNEMTSVIFSNLKDLAVPQNKRDNDSEDDLNFTKEDVNKIKKIFGYINLLDNKEGKNG